MGALKRGLIVVGVLLICGVGLKEYFSMRTARVAQPVFARYCGGCHRVDGVKYGPGPDLSAVGSRRSASEIRAKILNPATWRVGGNYPQNLMPMTFSQVLEPDEIDAVAEWLSKKRDAGGSST